jgi:hypothetical protein
VVQQLSVHARQARQWRRAAALQSALPHWSVLFFLFRPIEPRNTKQSLKRTLPPIIHATSEAQQIIIIILGHKQLSHVHGMC